MKLSFTISSKPSSCPNNSGKSQPPAPLPAAEPQPQFVTVFDPAPPRPPARPRYVILPIPNTFLLRLREKTKTVSLPLPSDDPTAIPSANPDSTAIPSSLTFRSTANDSDSQIDATRRPEQVSDDPKVSKELDKPAAAPLKDAEETVRVSGCHAGLKRKILERRGSSELISKLLESGEEVRVEEDMVAKLQSREERCLKKLKGLETRQRDEKREESRSQDCRREEEKSRDIRRERRSREEQAKPAEKLTGIGIWLTSYIRVRIINKYFRGGKLYRKTGKVLDVVSPNTCDILMDESGEFLQGVDQEIIETALPECFGGSVLVLYGKHKGVYGSLVVRDRELKMGLIIDADSHALIVVCLDQIAEYVGDPSYLDY